MDNVIGELLFGVRGDPSAVDDAWYHGTRREWSGLDRQLAGRVGRLEDGDACGV